MNYFKKFPNMYYNVDGIQRIVTDITRNVRVNSKLTETESIYYPYRVHDGEMPEKVSQRFYDTEEYHWIILLINNIGNIYTEWALPDDILLQDIMSKYDDINAVHHWENSRGQVVMPPSNEEVAFYDAEPVTNYEYEIRINDAKRDIKILSPVYLTEFKKQFEKLITQ